MTHEVSTWACGLEVRVPVEVSSSLDDPDVATVLQGEWWVGRDFEVHAGERDSLVLRYGGGRFAWLRVDGEEPVAVGVTVESCAAEALRLLLLADAAVTWNDGLAAEAEAILRWLPDR